MLGDKQNGPRKRGPFPDPAEAETSVGFYFVTVKELNMPAM